KSRNDNLQSLTLDMERSTTFGRVSFDLTDNVTVFTELGWSRTRAKNSHSLQTFDFVLRIQPDNAFLPQGLSDYILDPSNPYSALAFGTTNVDLPPVAGDNTREFKRVMAGLE